MSSLARESDLDFLLDLLCEDTEEEEQYLDAIQQLDKAGVLLSRQIGISKYLRFERSKVSEVIYEDLSNGHRIELHIKIASLLEQQYKRHKTLKSVSADRRALQAGRANGDGLQISLDCVHGTFGARPHR